MDHEGEPARISYDAFVSYRRACDERTARSLQRFLERRLPWDTLRRERPLRVFLDENELDAGGTLPHRLTDAIRRSRALVVVCSKDSASSRYVALEVEAALLHLGADHVIPVLLDDPPDVFPPPLRSGDVLAAVDLRRRLPGESARAASARRRRESLRLAAAVLSVPVDALVGRRRKYRRTVLGQAGVILLVICALATGWAGFLRTETGTLWTMHRSMRSEILQSADSFPNYVLWNCAAALGAVGDAPAVQRVAAGTASSLDAIFVLARGAERLVSFAPVVGAAENDSLLVDEALRILADFRGDPDELHAARREVASALAATDRVPEALACARGVADASGRCAALFAVVDRASRLPAEEIAATVQLLFESAESVDDGVSRVYAWGDVAKALPAIAPDRIDDALQRVDAALGSIRDPTNRDGAALAASHLASELGKLKDARRYVDLISDGTMRNNALCKLTEALSDADRVEEAESTLREISHDLFLSEAQASVAVAIARGGDRDRAAELARAILLPSDRCAAYQHLAGIAAAETPPSTTEASRFHRLAVEAASKTEDGLPRVRYLARIGEFRRAAEVVRRIGDADERAYARAVLINETLDFRRSAAGDR
jgi:hypothetical protein